MASNIKLISSLSTPSEVTLLVITHNGKEITQEFFKRFQTHTDISRCNLVVLDNGSTDGTIEWMSSEFSEDKSIAVLSSRKNLGIIEGRNECYRCAANMVSPHYVLFLDNDQYVLEGWLEQHIRVLESGYDIIGVEAWQMSPTYLPKHKLKRWGRQFNYVGCGGMMIKNEVIEKIGLFDMRFNPAYFEDPDFCLRAYQNNYKIGWNATAKIVHLGHKTLGAQGQQKKQTQFMKSWTEFKNKWKRTKMPNLIQPFIPAFEDNL